VPTEKRARKRAQREARLAELERRRRRRASIRRTITIVVLAAVAVGIYFAAKPGPAKKAPPPKPGSQLALDAAAARAGCPSKPTTPLKKTTYSSPPALTIDTSRTYTADVTTDIGSFTITLDAKDAPNTVNSFVFLAQRHFFDCDAFMRVIPGFMEQTGSPNQSNGGPNSGPGYEFGNENSHPANGYVLGDVAMANSATPNTNGSQFFVLAVPEGKPYNPFTSDPSSIGYSLFGHVTSGIGVVQKINADGNSNSSASGIPPKITHRILRITISSS
jgi:cyclophilin family peptidyl-prolyl cis-trans isomerase